MRHLTALCCGVSLLLSPAVLADDSAATLGAGGLVLQKTDKVVLVAEDLYLSATGIRISYRFRNASDADYTSVIAFPMPEFTGEGPDRTTAIPDPASDNFMKFQTIVDGQPVVSRLEQRAFLKAEGKPDVEITDQLKALHIPLMPTEEATAKAVAGLTAAQRKSLVAAGIFDLISDDDAEGPSAVLYPLWTLRSKYWRTQTFPKGKEITVQQSYIPVIGSQAALSLGSPTISAEQARQYRERYCTDDAFLAAAHALYKKGEDDKSGGFQAFEQYLQYIITSGGNWAGPIGDFRLIVDKGDTNTLVSFCGNGVKKISPTQYALEIRNYTPSRDIDVLFLRAESPHR